MRYYISQAVLFLKSSFRYSLNISSFHCHAIVAEKTVNRNTDDACKGDRIGNAFSVSDGLELLLQRGKCFITHIFWYKGDGEPQLRQIEDSAFGSCINLNVIEIPATVTEIKSNAFYGCKSLCSIIIPDSVSKIGNNAFEQCSNLSDVYIGACVNSIESGAFRDCASLKTIEIPNSVTLIGGSSFARCGLLETVYVGTGVNRIDYNAFEKCESLIFIRIQNETPPSLASARAN